MLNSRWGEYLSNDALDCAMRLEMEAHVAKAHGTAICPPPAQIFRAFELTPPEKVKVVICGQDPYPGAGVANGLAFSVNKGQKIPASLKNIFKELCADIGCDMPTSGDLTPWAKRGVLLLNTALTVEQGRRNSHKDWGWETLTRDALRVCVDMPQPVAFLLWGAKARMFAVGTIPMRSKNKGCICASHPSPLGATKGNEAAPAFLGSRPFSQANQFIKAWGAETVDWRLP